MDAFHLGFPDDFFDAAFSQGFFEHFSEEEIALLLEEQTRVARHVVISVPNHAYRVRDFGNERLLSRQQWEELFERLGYRLLTSHDYAPMRTHFWRGGRDMYLAVVQPRRVVSPPSLAHGPIHPAHLGRPAGRAGDDGAS
jgi:ubiquinone/menaquinone biosynthesis C-methylase UbiE